MRRLLLAALAFATLAVPLAGPANAQAGIKVGVLTCDVAAGQGYILASRKALVCTFSSVGGRREIYDGSITRVGLDAGITTASRIVWAVFAPASSVAPGALEGRYAGVGAEATAGIGLGANALIGGFDRSINLIPLSIQGQTGANIAAGIGYLRLFAPPPVVVQPVYKR